jgi:mannitol-1-/sugar-/sorbitol-6-phosphatase
VPFSCDAIIFDLDGVLVDSFTAIQNHWKSWGDLRGLSLEQIMRVAHGLRTVDTIRRVAPHLDAEKEAAAFEAMEVSDATGLVAYRGAASLLETIPKASWAIVTSGSKSLASARLRHTDLPMPQIMITSDDVRNGKPDPEAYLLAASRMMLPAGRCVVVEDSPPGLKAARAAGMTAIAVATTHSAAALGDGNAIVAGVWDIRVSVEPGKVTRGTGRSVLKVHTSNLVKA